jgi:glycosyltransferase involved in cell wall biosynthesis
MTDAKRWIVVVEEPFLPADAGGRVETFSFLLAALAAGVDARVVIPAQTGLDLTDYEAALPGVTFGLTPRDRGPRAILTGQPYVHSSRPTRALRRELAGTTPRADAVISYSCRSSHLGEEIAQAWGIPHLVRAHNVDSEYFRVLASNSSGARRIGYELEYHKLRRAEQDMHHSPFVTCIADISLADHAWRAARASVPTMHLPPFLPAHIVAGGANEAGEAGGADGAGGAEAGGAEVAREPAELLFVGSLDTPTNIEAIRWLAAQAWPLVRERRPDATLTVVGRRAEPGLLAELRAIDGATVHTDVPAVTPYLRRAAVSINPTRSGSGVNIKAVEAMAAGLPVVTTDVGARGLDWQPERDLLVGADLAGFVEAVLRLLDDKALAGRIGAAGQAFVTRELDHRTLIERVAAALG